jgi:soluble lytic murein transglycosylase
MSMLRILLLACCLMLQPLRVAAQADPLAPARAEFVAALAAVPRGDAGVADSVLLRSYPLYPYLEAERLAWQLARGASPPDALIGEYLQRNGDAPWTRSLRADWLGSLAARARWTEFLAHDIEARADTTLRCQRLEALLASGASPAPVEPALAIWRTGAELPAACAPVFDALRAQGLLGVEQVAERTRLALEAGKVGVARMLIRQLPEAQRGSYQLWLDAINEPARHLERAIALGVDPKGAIDGFTKLARANADEAAVTLARIERACAAPACVLRTPGTVGEMRREIALNLAWSRRPETVAMFRMVPQEALDERAHEWRVRAALWAGDWVQAHAWIAALPAALAEQPRWRYWRARSAQKLDRAEAARPDYERLAQENGYYAVLAAERLDRAYTPRAQARPSDPAARELIATMPGLQRAREAWRIEQRAWARSEWNEATASFDAAHLLEAARLAASWGWHLQTVATATRAEVFDDFDLLYPRPYEAELTAAARRVQLPAEWVWGVLRQESLYDPRARSSANALGLLQLLPATARNVARRNGFPAPSEASLFDPPTNLLLGTHYLREQYETFGGRFVLVLGAYNAGPNAVRRWLPAAPMETDVWIENVPFNETRSYIQRIVWHSTVFAWEASGKPQRITPWLVPISADLTPVAPDAP